MPTQGDALG